MHAKANTSQPPAVHRQHVSARKPPRTRAWAVCGPAAAACALRRRVAEHQRTMSAAELVPRSRQAIARRAPPVAGAQVRGARVGARAAFRRPARARLQRFRQRRGVCASAARPASRPSSGWQHVSAAGRTVARWRLRRRRRTATPAADVQPRSRCSGGAPAWLPGVAGRWLAQGLGQSDDAGDARAPRRAGRVALGLREAVP